ncbi:hypothetical protein BGX27_000117 [Mortierella sp. AM989]|nr:hypothetical protein BGX27_000117 [Mortierella sp. AM989]
MTFKTLTWVFSPTSSDAPSLTLLAPSSSSISLSSSSVSDSVSSPVSSHHRLCLRPSPSPIRRPLPQHWMYPSTTTLPPSLTPTLKPQSQPNHISTTPSPLNLTSASDVPLDSDPDLRLLHVLANHLNGAYRPLSRPRQRILLSPTCSPQLIQQQKLVFASGAVGTASALGHVFGRPLQVKETVPCSPQSCTQLQKELQNTLIQQSQSPSHTFQQQCSVHKRFRLFRQRPKKCPVHSQPSGPNYVLPPTTVHPLAVHPDKILLDYHKDPVQSGTWKPTLTSSTSTSSRLSSYSNVSLSLSTSSLNHGSDGEGYNSGTFQPFKKKKKQSKKEQQQLRCLCYLDTSLDQQDISKQAKTHSHLLSSWYPQKHQKETSRLRRIWNDSTIFHWSKSPSSTRHSQQQPQQQQQQPQDIALYSSTESSLGQSPRSQPKLNENSQRNSLTGTDFSDEGNHSLSDVEYDDECHAFYANDHLNRVSFQDHCSSKSRSSRPGDDLKAISRHQAELSQMPGPSSHRENRFDDVQPIQESRPLASTFVADDDDDDDDEDWDIQSDSGAPSSSPMYSADAREPTSYSTVALPLSSSKSYLKKPSSANLNTLRSRQRCLSLPTDSVLPGFRKMSSTPSENWDEDFDIDSGDISVPTQVVDNQISLQMDIYNIKDFASQIEDLKSLRASLRLASSSLKERNPKKHQDLSMLFQRDWEQAEVIIDLGEIAQTSTSSSITEPALAAGPLSLLSGERLSTLSISKSSGQNPRRPALSATGLATLTSSSPATTSFAASTTVSPLLNSTERPISQSSSLAGTTIAGSSTGGDSETDVASRSSSRSSSGLTADMEKAVEGLAIAQSEKRRPNLGSGVTPLRPMQMKESCSSPAAFGLCTTPVTPLPNGLSPKEADDSEFYRNSPSEVELNSKWDQHSKEDSSATLKAVPMASNTSSGGGAGGVQAEIEASFRGYHKYGHLSKRQSSNQHMMGNDEEDDDGYESYGYGDGTSIGVITPIPTDRHMQVLKDILMERLGSDVARQYMFKHGEQDHVRFSVEVIPGLLDHLKVLQQRLGDQLMELQQLAVLV